MRRRKVGKIDLSLLGPCGIYCGGCDIFLAHKNGDRGAQKQIAEWIERHTKKEVRPEQIVCLGCLGPMDRHWSPDCKVLICAKSKKVKTCVDCGEYPGCRTLEDFYQGGDYESARKTLERISEIGLDEWVKEREADAAAD